MPCTFVYALIRGEKTRGLSTANEITMTSKRTANYYLYTVSLGGFAILSVGLLQLITDSLIPDFGLFLLLLFLLVAAAEIANTSISFLKNVHITMSVSTAVSMAVIPFWGPATAGVAVFIANAALWIVKPQGENWRRSFRQLAFNSGMHCSAIFIAGVFFVRWQSTIEPFSIFGLLLWLFTAVLYDQLNFWLLMGMLRLQHGNEVSPITIWQEMGWAIPINIIASAFGGAILAYAVSNYDSAGILVFFLPIVLSAYAFRMYAIKMNAHMRNLEKIIEARTKERDAFLAVLTHDMRTPLTGITLYADMLRTSPEVAQAKPYIYDVMLRSAKTLKAIVEDILELSEFENSNGTVTLQKEICDISQLVETTAELMQGVADLTNIQIIFDTATDVSLEIDRSKIERVIYNLLSNAIKYSGSHNIVQVAITRSKDFCLITVSDNGTGIPEAQLDKIFNSFYRVDEHKTMAAGTGLGLTASKIIVDAHGGKIDVVSHVGHGSTFTVYLPV